MEGDVKCSCNFLGQFCKMKNTGWESINLRSPKCGRGLNFYLPEMQLFLKPTSKSISWRLRALGLGKWSSSILVCSPLLASKTIFLFPTSSFPTLSYTNLSSFYIRPLYCRGCCRVASLVGQTGKVPPAMQETRVWSLGQEGPLEKRMAAHSGILARGNPMKRGAWQATGHGSQRVWLDWVANCRGK